MARTIFPSDETRNKRIMDNELNSTSYITGYSDGSNDTAKRLYDWLLDPNREPAQTKFTAGSLRNVAKEIEFRLNESRRKTIINK